jgi:hypothetical protein
MAPEIVRVIAICAHCSISSNEPNRFGASVVADD